MNKALRRCYDVKIHPCFIHCFSLSRYIVLEVLFQIREKDQNQKREVFLAWCCDLTFRADSGQNMNLEHLYITEVLMHANATIMFKDNRYSL